MKKSSPFLLLLSLSLFCCRTAICPATQEGVTALDKKALVGDDVATGERLPATISLFEGTKLENFDFFLEDNVKREEVFSLTEDGVLTIAGKPAGWIGTKKEYKNFTLSVEYRWLEKNEPGTGGIFLRLNGERDRTVPRCLKVQLQYAGAGDLFGYGGMKLSGDKERYLENLNHRSGELRQLRRWQHPETPGPDAKPEQWNSLLVHCFEGLLVVRINGRIVNWAHGAETVAGRIAFQSGGGKIEFRNAILIEEL